MLIDAQPNLDRNRYADGFYHGSATVRHELWVKHEARAEAVARAAASLSGAPTVQVDLIVACLLSQPGAPRELVWIRASQLEH
eukprot:scaffold215543_cov39-Tisochrysis_lutea.AAC.1